MNNRSRVGFIVLALFATIIVVYAAIPQNTLRNDYLVVPNVNATNYFLSSVNITDGLPLQEADYIITTDGITTQAINGNTGATEFTGTSGLTVSQSVVDALPTGGKIFYAPGNFTFTDELIDNGSVNVYLGPSVSRLIPLNPINLTF